MLYVHFECVHNPQASLKARGYTPQTWPVLNSSPVAGFD
jgi:hypothetical protein